MRIANKLILILLRKEDRNVKATEEEVASFSIQTNLHGSNSAKDGIRVYGVEWRAYFQAEKFVQANKSGKTEVSCKEVYWKRT